MYSGSDFLGSSPSDRKISFAFFSHDAKSDSDRSSASNISVVMETAEDKKSKEMLSLWN